MMIDGQRIVRAGAKTLFFGSLWGAIQLFLIAALIFASAGCSDRKYRQRVNEGSTGKRTFVRACSNRVSGSVIRVDESMSVAKGASDSEKPKVLVCSAGKTSELVRRYTIVKTGGALSVALKAGLEFPEIPKVENPERSALRIKQGAIRVLRESCLQPFETAWKHSRSGVELDLAVGEVASEDETALATADKKPEKGQSEKADQTFDPDQVLRLGLVAAKDLKGDVALSIIDGESNSQILLYPLATTEGAEACKGLDKVAQKKCLNTVRAKLNRPFCLEFARRTAIWLGLGDPRAEKNLCADPTFKPDLKSGFHSALLAAIAQSERGEAGEFWSKARFTLQDVKTVLGPVCQTR